jgi:long-chain fatty acid transport protein
VIGALVVLAWAAVPAQGGGIEVINQGARGAAQAETFAAQADDATAIYYNPAGLTQLTGTQITAGGYLLWPQIRFSGPAGSESMWQPSLLPHVYAETSFGLENWRFGIGVNNVFGLNEDYGDKGPLRFLADKAHLYLFNIAPTVAYRLTDSLSIAAELNVYYGDLELRHNALLGPPPVPEGSFRFTGQDVAVGGTLGVMWKIDPRNTLAAVYRSPFSMDFGGKAQVTAPGIPTIGPSDANAKFDFPQMATIAYAVRPVKPWKLEVDAVWTDWSVAKQIVLNSKNPAFNGQKIPEDWKDSFSYRFGTQWDLNRNWALRAGYAYGTNAVPASTFSPLVPDGAYHLISTGFGYSNDNWSIDAAFQYIYRERRHISGDVNAVADGTWDNTMYGFMVTFTAKL